MTDQAQSTQWEGSPRGNPSVLENEANEATTACAENTTKVAGQVPNPWISQVEALHSQRVCMGSQWSQEALIAVLSSRELIE